VYKFEEGTITLENAYIDTYQARMILKHPRTSLKQALISLNQSWSTMKQAIVSCISFKRVRIILKMRVKFWKCSS